MEPFRGEIIRFFGSIHSFINRVNIERKRVNEYREK